MGGRIKRKVPPLADVPCELHLFPIGTAVRIQFPTGSSIDDCDLCQPSPCDGISGWFLVTFKIGDTARGSRNLRALFVPPTDLAWPHSPDHCHLVAPDVQVVEVAWPVRPADAERAEVADPVGGSAGDGPLFANRCAASDADCRCGELSAVDRPCTP
jgi:hypothetical protein